MENCTKFGQLILSKIIKSVATSCHILRLKCTKFAPPQTPLGELTALPQSPSRGLLLRGREGGVEGKGGERRGGEGKGKNGGLVTPLLQRHKI